MIQRKRACDPPAAADGLNALLDRWRKDYPLMVADPARGQPNAPPEPRG
jgi:hypothetical protein